MKSILLVVAAALLVVIVVAPNTHPFASASAKANADTLRQMEAQLMKDAAKYGSHGYMSYYADDAVEVPDHAPIIQGKGNIAKAMGFLDDTSNHLTWTPVGADICSSGDLGYTYGTFEFRFIGKDGQPAVEHGKYTSIWKKQRDGGWKVVLDMGNSSSEAPQ
jgi:ketosteroid isomerase-like protein